jgi:hypothetical protein
MIKKELNIIELLALLIIFLSGFLPGVYVANRAGIALGACAGFFFFVVTFIILNNIRYLIYKKLNTPNQNKKQ